jgi:hypothetical protein
LMKLKHCCSRPKTRWVWNNDPFNFCRDHDWQLHVQFVCNTDKYFLFMKWYTNKCVIPVIDWGLPWYPWQDAKDPETLANFVVCSLHIGKSSSRYLRLTIFFMLNFNIIVYLVCAYNEFFYELNHFVLNSLAKQRINE